MCCERLVDVSLSQRNEIVDVLSKELDDLLLQPISGQILTNVLSHPSSPLNVSTIPLLLVQILRC